MRRTPLGRRNLAWFGGPNAEMTAEEWQDGTRRTLGMYVANDDARRITDEAFLIWFRREAMQSKSTSPTVTGRTYTVVAHTGLDGELPEEKISRRLDTADSRPYGRGSPGRLTPVSAGS